MGFRFGCCRDEDDDAIESGRVRGSASGVEFLDDVRGSDEGG